MYLNVPLHFLHAVARALAMANQGLLACDPQSYLLTLGKLALFEVLTSSPRSAAQAPALTWLVDLLKAAELLQCLGDKLQATAQVSHWLAWPPEQQLRHLRDACWQHPAIHAAWMPANRYQSDLIRHYDALFFAICQWIQTLSSNVWVNLGEVEAYLNAQGVLEPVSKSNLPQVRAAWDSQIRVLVEFILTTPLPMLGLLEIDVTREPLHFRPTPEGCAWLRTALERRALWQDPPSSGAVEMTVPPTRPALPVLRSPPLTLTTLPHRAALRLAIALPAPSHVSYHVMHFAVPQIASPGTGSAAAAMIYHVTRESLEQALAYGYALPDIVLMLGRWSGGEVTAECWDQLVDWQDEIRVIPYTPGYCLHTSPGLSAALRQKRPFRTRTTALREDQGVWVAAGETQALFRYLRRLGYTLHPQADDNALTLCPSIAAPKFPRLALWVLLHTYQNLCLLLPGMARLQLTDLLSDLDRTLSPAERRAAQRLVDSQADLLAQHLASARCTTSAESEDPPVLSPPVTGQTEYHAVIQAAIAAEQVLEITYIDTQGQLTRRRVRPLHLETQGSQSYLVAHCALRDAIRHFRMDRIVDVAMG